MESWMMSPRPHRDLDADLVPRVGDPRVVPYSVLLGLPSTCTGALPQWVYNLPEEKQASCFHVESHHQEGTVELSAGRGRGAEVGLRPGSELDAGGPPDPESSQPCA